MRSPRSRRRSRHITYYEKLLRVCVHIFTQYFIVLFDKTLNHEPLNYFFPFSGLSPQRHEGPCQHSTCFRGKIFCYCCQKLSHCLSRFARKLQSRKINPTDHIEMSKQGLASTLFVPFNSPFRLYGHRSRPYPPTGVCYLVQITTC